MKTTTFALLSAVVGSASAQGVTDKISPQGGIPAGFSTSYDSKFEIAVVDVKTISARDTTVEKRATTCSTDGILVASLKDGVLTDALSRSGYIASNYQFQFDGPPQAGALYTAGWSINPTNKSLALGPSATFYKCQSGSFYNLYDRSWAAQCSPVQILIVPCGQGDASQLGDGQVIGTTVRPTTVVIPLSDGQPQVITTVVPVPLCQISDGQLQVHTTPCASITSKPTPSTTLIPVSQYTDGQLQVTPGNPAPPATAAPPAPPAPTASVTATGGSVVPAPGTTTKPVNSTIITTAKPTTTSSVSSSPSTTSTLPANAAGRFEMSSPLAALAIGVLGAVWVL